MSQVQLVFDNQLKQGDIIMPLITGDDSEADSSYNFWKSDIAQTKVYGVVVPLIKINNIVVSWEDILYFELKSTGVLPQVTIEVNDKMDKISRFDTNSQDNELRIQVLPAFDGAYKKINLTFFISSMRISDHTVSISGTYKLPELIKDRFECFGELSTYEIFEKIAIDTKLGFATNCGQTDNNTKEDKRYMYCNSKSYLDIMSDEIINAKVDSSHIYDWWVDLWNNINLVNIAERYDANDSDEDLQIWISTNPGEMLQGANINTIQIPAFINNHPGFGHSELYVRNYDIIQQHGSQHSSGTDKICTVYMDHNKSFEDVALINSDIKEDITVKQEYMGEVYGAYNYMLERFKRSSYLQKKKTETIQVSLARPILALMRGHKVNFGWYVNDGNYESNLKHAEESGYLNNSALIDPWGGASYMEPGEGYENFRLDPTVSGQYLITGCDMIYEDNEWHYILNLTRPCTQKQEIIDKNKFKETT